MSSDFYLKPTPAIEAAFKEFASEIAANNGRAQSFSLGKKQDDRDIMKGKPVVCHSPQCVKPSCKGSSNTYSPMGIPLLVEVCSWHVVCNSYVIPLINPEEEINRIFEPGVSGLKMLRILAAPQDVDARIDESGNILVLGKAVAKEVEQPLIVMMVCEKDGGDLLMKRTLCKVEARHAEKEPPKDAPFQVKNNESFLKGVTSGRIVLGASVRGRFHAVDGKFRDDAMKCGNCSEAGLTVIAVADGASCSEYARQGAGRVASSFVAAIEERTTALRLSEFAKAGRTEDYVAVFGDIIANSGREALLQIGVDAKAVKAPFKAFYTTLVLAVMIDLPNDQLFVSTFSIGDSLALVVEGDEVRRLNWQDVYDENATLFVAEELLDKAKIVQRIMVRQCPGNSIVSLMTDGVSKMFFPDDASITQVAWMKLFKRTAVKAFMDENTESAFVQAISFRAGVFGDDRTLVFFLRKGMVKE